jgi:hypothetical protein
MIRKVSGDFRLGPSSTEDGGRCERQPGLPTNPASSTYDALQASLTNRLSRNFSAGLHYTWSTLIDDVTDVFAASTSESARSQDSFDRRADRARSGYDRPHRDNIFSWQEGHGY